MDSKYTESVTKALHQVKRELQRQAELQQAGRFQFVAYDKGCSEVTRLAMLTEELGEVARTIQESDDVNLEEELIQVAAICVSWASRLIEDEPGQTG